MLGGFEFWRSICQLRSDAFIFSFHQLFHCESAGTGVSFFQPIRLQDLSRDRIRAIRRKGDLLGYEQTLQRDIVRESVQIPPNET